MSVPVSELQGIAPSSIIELFVLELNVDQHGVNDVYRFHAGTNLKSNGDLVWAGNTYSKMPVEAEGFEYNGQGTLPRPKIRVANVLGTITAILLTLPNGLEGAKVTRKRTLARYLDAVNFPGDVNPLGTPDPTAEFPAEVFYVSRKTVESRDVIEFELTAAFDLQNVRAPKRQCISSICQWEYRSAECGYTEALYFNANDEVVPLSSQDVCGKRLSSCRLRFDRITRTGTVTKNSTTLAVNSTSGIIAGHSIYGFGIPANTTVVSVTNATALVMSNAATVTNPISMTGTVSSTGPTMTVANGANLVIGMTVTGTYIPAGTTITAISGNTVTLSNRPYEFTRTGSFFFGFLGAILTPLFQIANGGSITPGYRVFGSQQINTTVSSNTPGGLLFNLVLNAIGSFATLVASPSMTPVQTTLYFIPNNPTQSTYSFSAGNQIFFRTQQGTLPFGSFPGVGTYFT